MASAARIASSYFIVDQSFSQQQRDIINRAIIDIFKFKDSEGKSLIESAINNRGGKIFIKPTHVLDTSYSIRDRVIYLNTDQISALEYVENGKFVRPGITAILTHELYHASDSTDVGNLYISHAQKTITVTLKNFGIKEPQKFITEICGIGKLDRLDVGRFAELFSTTGNARSAIIRQLDPSKNPRL